MKANAIFGLARMKIVTLIGFSELLPWINIYLVAFFHFSLHKAYSRWQFHGQWTFWYNLSNVFTINVLLLICVPELVAKSCFICFKIWMRWNEDRWISYYERAMRKHLDQHNERKSKKKNHDSRGKSPPQLDWFFYNSTVLFVLQPLDFSVLPLEKIAIVQNDSSFLFHSFFAIDVNKTI